jgi:hypothetical protein
MAGILRGMQVADILAIGLLICGSCTLALGCASLAQARDLYAIYWLVIGVTALRSAVRLSRPGAMK